jgi:glycosyltransferase involved in cell wall biosynthesis
MAGDGPLFEKMKFLTQELNVNNSIVFYGKVKDVAKLYSNASIFVLPSVIEGFPNALIEAMSFGLPCICFSDIPYEDIVEDQTNGIVVKERTPLLLAGTIQNLIIQPNIRAEIGNQAMNSINSKCNPQHIAEKIGEFMNFKIG